MAAPVPPRVPFNGTCAIGPPCAVVFPWQPAEISEFSRCCISAPPGSSLRCAGVFSEFRRGPPLGDLPDIRGVDARFRYGFQPAKVGDICVHPVGVPLNCTWVPFSGIYRSRLVSQGSSRGNLATLIVFRVVAMNRICRLGLPGWKFSEARGKRADFAWVPQGRNTAKRKEELTMFHLSLGGLQRSLTQTRGSAEVSPGRTACCTCTKPGDFP